MIAKPSRAAFAIAFDQRLRLDPPMENFAYFLLGVVATTAVSAYFFVQSGWQLKREAKLLREESEKLRRLQELTIYAQTNPNAHIQPTRDEAGNITGLTVCASGSSRVMASARATLTLTPTPNAAKE
jgi:hypothetical protein